MQGRNLEVRLMPLYVLESVLDPVRFFLRTSLSMIKLKSAIDRRLPDSQIRTDRPNGLKFRDVFSC